MRTDEAIEAYVRSRRARRCSPAYEAWLRYHLGHLARAHVELPVRPEPLEELLGGLSGLSEATVYGTWVVLRRLYRWLSSRRRVKNAAAALEAPIVRRKLLRTLAEWEVDEVLQANRGRRRDYALLLFLLDTGARIGEAYGLRWADVGRDRVRLRGKTGERSVPISPATLAALKRTGTVDGLWLGKRGPLTLGGLQAAVRAALERGGIRGGPHLLRHTLGRLYILAGGDVFSLQRVMGHTKLETTRRYVDLDDRDVLEQHALFSPVARRQLQAVG